MSPLAPARAWRPLVAAALATLAACAHCGDASPQGAAVAPTPHAAAAATRPQACPDDAVRDPRGRCVPRAWHCSPLAYASGDGCDCNCGAVDPDCETAAAATPHWCVYGGVVRQVDSCGACAATEAEGWQAVRACAAPAGAPKG